MLDARMNKGQTSTVLVDVEVAQDSAPPCCEHRDVSELWRALVVPCSKDDSPESLVLA